MFYVAHMYGFLREDIVMNGKHHPKFTKDIREAKAFASFGAAQAAIRANTLNRHFAILNTNSEEVGAA